VTLGVHVVRGTDPVLRDRAAAELVTELLAGDDASFALEEFTIPGRAAAGDDPDAPSGAEGREGVLAAVLNAAESPPFMTERRVVVVREVGALTAGDAAGLVRYLESPLETTELVLVTGGGSVPPALAKQLDAMGASQHGPASEKTSDVLVAAAHEAGLTFTADAARAIVAHLGDDAGRVGALIDVLAAAYGAAGDVTATPLGIDAVSPYLGDAGAVPAYQLTNAIEGGDAAGALAVLRRLLTVSSPRQPKPMHPLQVMGVLTSYYRRVLRLDDPAVDNSAAAVAALGGKVKEYPARKALDQARALGTDGIRQAFDLLYQADLDLKGARAIPGDAVMELLVVRLAGLAGASGSPRRGRRRPPGR
jgi:DNA polymerase III subunit delta